MTSFPERDRPAIKSVFAKAAIGLAAAAALVAGAVYFSGSDSAPAKDDPMSAAQKIVTENMAKPCAAEAAGISAILLSDPNLKCDGPKVVAP